ncbi:TIGR04222 domain-containing membrane protein [Streptomyces zaomyceticus]|uniref:TIGR04222 domain-containing membrane protein n=1 Tax=Streptomyces zaomyceticus TaxID=68286 RepID=UPI0032456A60
MARGYHGSGAGDGSEQVLDLYAYAYLAGGRQRVVESVIISLVERGVVSLRAARLRAVGGEAHPQHPVERALLAVCPRSMRVEEVIEALRDSHEIDEVAGRLVALRLLSSRRRRTTRAGRRRLASAISEGSLPVYVREGPVALAPGSVRYGLLSTRTVPDGLGRRLMRMGKALDDDRADTTGSGPDAGFGCGGGAGGGD